LRAAGRGTQAQVRVELIADEGRKLRTMGVGPVAIEGQIAAGQERGESFTGQIAVFDCD
jgi:ribosomal protein S28E/S33